MYRPILSVLTMAASILSAPALGYDDRDCVNTGGADCVTAAYLGAVPGDESAPPLTVDGCGGAWFEFEVVESSGFLQEDLNVEAVLTGPYDGTDYDLRILEDCSTVLEEIVDPTTRRKRIFLEWSDVMFVDDSRTFALEIGLTSGEPTGQWRLEIRGNTSALSGTSPAAARLLRQNAPNPFNPATTIRYSVPADAHVKLDVLSPDGRRVATLVDGWRGRGDHVVRWRALDDRGRRLPSGTYACRLAIGAHVEIRRMTVLK